MERRIVGVVIGQDAEKTIEMTFKSLKDCDKIYFIDGGSKDGTIEIAKDYCDFIFDDLKFNKHDPIMPGKQKNFILKKLLEWKHEGDWIIHLDADEVLDDNGIEKIKNNINNIHDVYDIRMRHLIENFIQEDNTKNIHRTPTRVFKLTKDLYFPETEHSILQGYKNCGFMENPIVWHLAYCGGMFDVKRRYDGQKERYNPKTSHNLDFLERWYRAHLFGQYPKRQFNPVELPKNLLDYFSIDKDELYFSNRGLEAKHFVEAIAWKDFFKCKTAFEVGCGRGPRVYALNNIGVETLGYELSNFAVENKFHENVMQGNILSLNNILNVFDLVIVYDILEHLNYEDLDKAINNLIHTTSQYILISVPVKGDPNLYNDPTHIIKEDKDWWIEQFTKKGLKQIETPKSFPYYKQIMIFKK